MRVEIAKKLFTVDEYYRMGEAGILDHTLRTELINGEIIEMSPIGDRHMECVDRANTILVPPLINRAIVSVQNAVRINNITMPQPDLVLYKFRRDFYKGRHEAKDVLLLIEVADSTFRYDRYVKLPLYASVGIREVWIEDLKNNRLLVFRDTAGKTYSTSLTFGTGQSITPLAFPDLTISIDELLGL
ncbi:MAG TPA: Uma2 family endonuclease [Terriglobia bacterium]|nr:Uma2 family endonuclease [Terriglobia bacterium]